MKPVSLPLANKKTVWLVCGWLLVGLVWPACGFFLSGNSQILKDTVVGLGCVAIVIVYLATLVVLFQHINDMGHHMGLVASAFLLSALCIIIIFASYITYYNLYLQIAVSGYRPMLHEDLFDPFYMSVATFTSLGCNDLIPQGFAGKFLIATETLIGMTHSVSFVTLLLLRITAEQRLRQTKP